MSADVLVCGSRDWDDEAVITRWLERVAPRGVIHGGARGADTLAGRAAERLGIPVRVFPADWRRYGRGAGPVRNQQMLDEGKPDVVLAFHSDLGKSRGTADMVRRAKAAGLRVVVVA